MTHIHERRFNIAGALTSSTRQNRLCSGEWATHRRASFVDAFPGPPPFAAVRGNLREFEGIHEQFAATLFAEIFRCDWTTGDRPPSGKKARLPGAAQPRAGRDRLSVLSAAPARRNSGSGTRV